MTEKATIARTAISSLHNALLLFEVWNALQRLLGVSFSSSLSQDVPNAADNRCFHDCPPHVTRACPRMFTTRNDLDGGSDFVVRKTIRLPHVS